MKYNVKLQKTKCVQFSCFLVIRIFPLGIKPSWKTEFGDNTGNLFPLGLVVLGVNFPMTKNRNLKHINE